MRQSDSAWRIFLFSPWGKSSPPAEGCRNGGVVFLFHKLWNLKDHLPPRVPHPVGAEPILIKRKGVFENPKKYGFYFFTAKFFSRCAGSIFMPHCVSVKIGPIGLRPTPLSSHQFASGATEPNSPARNAASFWT